MNKQLNLLYFSATNTTAKVVKAVADSMDRNYKEYNITLLKNRESEITFDENDLVIVGVPVYGGRIPVFLTDYFKKIKGNNTAAVFIAVYGNRDYDDALLELKDTFERNGLIGVAFGAFIGEHSYTDQVANLRPDENDLKIAHSFGVEIEKKLLKIKHMSNIPRLFVKGNFPYKERKPKLPMTPVTNDQCIDCGICANNCPMEAIDFNNFSNVDAEKCISCCSCIKKCPTGAKSINHELFMKVKKKLIDNFSTVRREPELYI